MAQEKEYYAFISYKREDEKWAKWLQDKLEHYKFPTNLNGRTDLPKNIRPTFRDVTDLTPGLLAEEINTALCNSEWLVVVCSPRSAKSPWVCKEAQTFIDLGRADHIIPFVIEGNPFSNDTSTECYPEALLNLMGSKELLAANINEMGRDAAAIKVVARMFNLRFDALWQRYERETRKKRNMVAVGVTVLLIVVVTIAGYIMKKNIDLNSAYIKISLQKDELDMKNDSIVIVNKLVRITNDSLKTKELALEESNQKLLDANDSIKKAYYKLNLITSQLIRTNKDLYVANAKNVSVLACNLIQQGEVFRAEDLLRTIIESDCNPLDIPEFEIALRKWNQSKERDGIIKVCKGFTPGYFKKIILLVMKILFISQHEIKFLNIIFIL